MKRLLCMASLLGSALTLAACEPDDSSDTENTKADAGDDSSEDDDPSEDDDSDALSGVDLLEAAVFRIEGTGTFALSLDTETEATVTGSGFVIDEEGHALTNSHVVSGATLLKVRFPNETRDRNVTVVARAECSDLALLKIDAKGGETFTPLEWNEKEPRIGTEIYAAGYPLGGDFTLTSGIISKASTPLESPWASVDDVLEHDATINPGNSGGPLVTRDGFKVLGVNYAGSVNNQYFAIGEVETFDLLDELMAGNDVYSVGVTGEAVWDGGYLSGVLVVGVRAGGPADDIGVLPGDLITHLGGNILEPDANGEMTMERYCDTLRSHNEGEPVKIRVLRLNTNPIQLLEGQLNGPDLEVIATGPVEDVVDFNVNGGDAPMDDGDTTNDDDTATDDDTPADDDTATGDDDTATGDDDTPADDDTTAEDIETFATQSGSISVEIPSAWGWISEEVAGDFGDVSGDYLFAYGDADDFVAASGSGIAIFASASESSFTAAEMVEGSGDYFDCDSVEQDVDPDTGVALVALGDCADLYAIALIAATGPSGTEFVQIQAETEEEWDYLVSSGLESIEIDASSL